jgi:hypothetical protein
MPRVPYQQVAYAARRASQQARLLMDQLQRDRHAQTGQAGALYLDLSLIGTRLLSVDPQPPPVAHVIPELERLLSECTGQLAIVQPLILDALRLARAISLNGARRNNERNTWPQ